MIVILESPYAGNLKRNQTYLRRALRDSLLRGESPFASHAIYTQPGVLDDDDPREREMGIRAGFAFRSVASKTVVYEDLGISSDMQWGINDAREHGHKIEYRRIGAVE